MRFLYWALFPALLAAALSSGTAGAADYYSRTTGGSTTGWNQNTTWTTDPDCDGAALGAGVFPGALDNVFICANKTVNITAAGAVARSVTFVAAGTTSSLVHTAAANSLTVGVGGVTINASSTVDCTRQWNIGAATATVNGSVSLVQNSADNQRIANITITTGTLNINGPNGNDGDLTINVGASVRGTIVMSGGAGNLNISRSFILSANFGTLTPKTTAPQSTVTYTSDSTATVATGAAVTYGDLIINKTGVGGVATASTLGTLTAVDLTVSAGTFATSSNDAVSVTGALAISAGAVLDIATSATVGVTGTTTVTGELLISAAAGGGAKTFTGNVTIANTTGKWNNTSNHNIALGGNLDNNHTAADFISGTGSYTCTNTRTFGGTGGGLVFAGNLVINGQRTTTTPVTVEGILSGSNTFINDVPSPAFSEAKGDVTVNALTNNANRIFKIGGNSTGITTLTATGAGNIIEYNGTGAQSIEATTYHHLTISNSAGTVATGGNLIIQGNFLNNGNFDTTTGQDTVSFSGGVAQTISSTAAGSTTFYGLTINNTHQDGVTLSGTHNVTVTDTLTLTAGPLVTGTNVVYVTRTAIAAVARTAGFVEGNLKWLAPAGNNPRTFPVGTHAGATASYTPVTLTYTGVTTTPAGSGITVSTTGSDHVNLAASLLSVPRGVNRYWTVSNDSTVLTSYDAQFTYVVGDEDVPAPALNSGLFGVQRYDGVAWTGSSISNNNYAAKQMTVTGETGYGAFAIAEVDATDTGYSSTLDRFNAYDPPNVTPTGSIHGLIRTKVAGAAFTLTVVHTNATETALQSFGVATVVTVGLYDASTSTGSFANNCWSSWTLIQQTTINFANTATTQTVAFTVNNSYKNVRVRMSGAGQVGCSGDAFAVRPASFDMTVSDLDASTAGTTRTLNATAFNGTPAHKAGLPFTIRVNSVTPGTATNFLQSTAHRGTPTSRTVACENPTGGSPACTTCSNGNLALGAFSIVSNVLNSTSTYSEAGVVSLTLEDKTYADVDAADTSEASRTIPQAAAFTAGRFIPNDFLITVFDPLTPPQFQTFGSTCGTRSFTYVGQNFGYVLGREPKVTITARNGLGSPTTTTNYRECLWKVTPAAVTVTPATTNPGKTLNGTPGSATVLSLGNGTGTVTLNSADSYNFSRSTTTPDAPFQAAINIGISAADADSVASNAFSFSPMAFDGTNFSPALTLGRTFVYGRLRLGNANGSHLVPLAVPMEAQFFSGPPANSFVTNAADQCTSISAANIPMGPYTQNLAACETSLSVGSFSSGRATILLTAPGSTAGVANIGSVTLAPRLEASNAGTTCIGGVATAVTGANQTHLQGNWTTPTYTQNPPARATFGTFQGSPEVIDVRENF